MEGFMKFFKKKEAVPEKPNPYPTSDAYRAAFPHIETHAAQLSKEAFLPRFLTQLNGGIGMPKLTDDEQGALTAYITYATKRLATGALYSPLNADLRKKIGGNRDHRLGRTVPDIANEAFNLAPVNMAAHDVIHTMIAYSKSKGRTLRPEYLRAESSDAQVFDRAPVEEELMVMLWNASDKQNFLAEVLAKGDARQAYDEMFKDAPLTTRELFYRHIASLEAVKDDQYTYVRKAFEAFFLSEQIAYTGIETEEKTTQLLADIYAHPDPLYEEMFDTLYKGLTASETERDRDIFIHTFLKQVAPLTDRLVKGAPTPEIDTP